MRISVQSGLVNVGSIDAVLSQVAKAAEHGLSGYWAPMLTGQDTLTVLAVAGRVVPDIELGTAVVPMPLRPPFALAQQAATVQEASGGRLLLGIGPSHEALVTNTFGLPWSPPLAATRRYLAELKPILAGTSDRRLVRPATPGPPILLGAVNPAMAELAAQETAGVITWAAGRVTVRDVLAPAARSAAAGEQFRIVTVLPLCVTSNPDVARELVRARLGANDRFPSYQKVLSREGVTSVADLAVVGTAAECAAVLDDLADCGMTDFGAHVVAADEADRDRTWEFLAEQAAARPEPCSSDVSKGRWKAAE